MQLKIKTSILRGGKRYDEGDKIELPNHIAANWISRGYASPIVKKQSKAKIETMRNLFGLLTFENVL